MREKLYHLTESIAIFLDTLKPHLIGAAAFLFMWLAPIHYSIAVVMIAMSVDTIAGRWAARRVAQRDGKVPREEVTSRKTRQGFTVKVVQYIGGILLTFMLDNLVLHDLVSYFFPSLSVQFFSTKFLAFIFVLIEFDSFDEKYYRVKGKSIKTSVVNKLKELKKVLFDIINIKKEL